MIPAMQKVARAALVAATGLPVKTRLPPADKTPDEFVVISRIGDATTTFATADPRFLVEVYATDELRAEELAQHVRQAWCSMRSHGVLWGHADRNLMRMDNPDTAGHSRFQFTGGLKVSLAHYA